MDLYSEKDLLREINYYDIPYHDDLKRMFSNQDSIHNLIVEKEVGTEQKRIENMLYSLELDENDLYNERKDFSHVLMRYLDGMYFKQDVEESELLGVDTPLRLIPFAELYTGDYLCFYFEKTEERPQIVIWDYSESDIDDAVIELISHDLDDFLNKIRV